MFGVAPNLKSLLDREISRQTGYVMLFDESRNHQLQRKEMDLHWGVDGVCWLWDFWTCNCTWCCWQNDSRSWLDWSEIVQLSMDGPHVNWKIFDMLQKEVLGDVRKMSAQYWIMWCVPHSGMSHHTTIIWHITSHHHTLACDVTAAHSVMSHHSSTIWHVKSHHTSKLCNVTSPHYTLPCEITAADSGMSRHTITLSVRLHDTQENRITRLVWLWTDL